MWNLKKFGNKIAFISEQNNEYSFNELDKFSNHIKNKIKKRSLILLLNDNSIASVFFYVGLIQNNHLILLLNSKNKLSYIKNIIKLYDPDFICSPKSQSFFEKKKIIKNSNKF